MNSVSMINGHEDGAPMRHEAVKNHICENCIYAKQGKHPDTKKCVMSGYEATIVSRSIPTDQYFWCKGKYAKIQAFRHSSCWEDTKR